MYLCVGKNGYYATTNDLNMIDTNVLHVTEVSDDFAPPEHSYPFVNDIGEVEWIRIPEVSEELENQTAFLIKDVFERI